jgi:hypothetical protein
MLIHRVDTAAGDEAVYVAGVASRGDIAGAVVPDLLEADAGMGGPAARDDVDLRIPANVQLGEVVANDMA